MYVTKRKLAVTIKPRLIISRSENQWCIEIDMKNKGTSTYFTEGTEVDTCRHLFFYFIKKKARKI